MNFYYVGKILFPVKGVVQSSQRSASPGYERLAAWMVMAADGTASIVNPSRVRLFALGMGQIAKTDPIDARMICDFASHTEPKPSKKPSATQRRLTALVERLFTEKRYADHSVSAEGFS